MASRPRAAAAWRAFAVELTEQSRKATSPETGPYLLETSDGLIAALGCAKHGKAHVETLFVEAIGSITSSNMLLTIERPAE
jgi:hypothetical protein